VQYIGCHIWPWFLERSSVNSTSSTSSALAAWARCIGLNDRRLGRDVALKVLPAAVAGDAMRLERFAREARALAALCHPNIMTAFSIEEAGGQHFFTMELVQGTPLAEQIPRTGLALSRIFDVALPAADALAAAPEKGIVHRDLKPANLMGRCHRPREGARLRPGEDRRRAPSQRLPEPQLRRGVPRRFSFDGVSGDHEDSQTESPVRAGMKPDTSGWQRLSPRW
jgi:serine/threonine protein kinase